MAIYGEENISLIVNGGNIKIESYDYSNFGGFFLKKEIIFNDGTFTFKFYNQGPENGNYLHALDSEGPITIKKGTYNILTQRGKCLRLKEIYI